jgi:glycosyltransferase involved in cell wall biosynthesis
LFLREDNTLSLVFYNSKSFKTKVIPFLVKLLYSYADLVVAVSSGVKDDLKKFTKLPENKIKVIYNPVITQDIFIKAKEPFDHPWFAEDCPPVILGVGRLTKEKDFPTLLKAFVLVRKEIDSRLVILGEGEERKNLEKLAKELGIEEFLWMPGFVDNPYKFMSKASVFVLSSIYEGLPTVLIEALALGCQVVSTDCKSGPREILDDGKSGKLVPAGNYKELAHAIKEILTYNIHYNIDKSTLEKYTLRYSSEEYLKLIFGEVG